MGKVSSLKIKNDSKLLKSKLVENYSILIKTENKEFQNYTYLLTPNSLPSFFIKLIMRGWADWLTAPAVSVRSTIHHNHRVKFYLQFSGSHMKEALF